ncbi:MAG: asparagine synthase (glutamine-hydrolyzing) [Anaerolineales bacterium]|nr:asparagine synthase (glutamine-hydrolyzing) [Anaerolineales bacterium]
MCGICGIFTVDTAAGQPAFAQAVAQMTALLHRRGPDDSGSWADPAGHLQLGFRRLAILDLSPAGHQPMTSASGRSVLVYNGEIYNFQALRHELEQKGYQFRSTGDSEVLLTALEEWGTDALPRLNGMFAFAWYDRAAQTLLLARDHAGIKPLYYFRPAGGQGIAFGSQYNILLQTPWGLPGDIRPDVLQLFLSLHHIPAPYGLLQNTYQLEPGHFLQVNADGSLHQEAWWQLPRRSEPDLFGDDAVEALAGTLSAAVARQRIADVPLGVFLSGGVDSPLITAIAREQTNAHLKAFTIGNPGWEQDESADAARFGQALDVDFRLHPMSSNDAMDAMQAVMAAQHEPFADFSILPTYFVSRFARSELTVALSGDGGDELFFGYERPLSLLQSGADFRWPKLVRMGLYGAGKYGLGPRRNSVILADSPGDYYFQVNGRLRPPDMRRLAPGLNGLPGDFDLYDYPAGGFDKHELAYFSRYVEFYGQLQRGLKKVDMASMHCSLEVRVPLLDREVIDVALRIDPFSNMAGRMRKVTLQKLLGRYVPPSTIPQAKRGFAIPLGDWLSAELRPLVEETLFNGSLYPDGLFDQKALQDYWQDHLNGHRSHKWGLWTLLTLQCWARTHLQTSSVPARTV